MSTIGFIETGDAVTQASGSACLVHACTGVVREYTNINGTQSSALVKSLVAGAVAVTQDGLAADELRDLLLEDLDEASVCLGDVWAAVEVRFQISQPRMPCWKPNDFGDDQAWRR